MSMVRSALVTGFGLLVARNVVEDKVMEDFVGTVLVGCFVVNLGGVVFTVDDGFTLDTVLFLVETNLVVVFGFAVVEVIGIFVGFCVVEPPGFRVVVTPGFCVVGTPGLNVVEAPGFCVLETPGFSEVEVPGFNDVGVPGFTVVVTPGFSVVETPGFGLVDAAGFNVVEAGLIVVVVPGFNEVAGPGGAASQIINNKENAAKTIDFDILKIPNTM